MCIRDRIRGEHKVGDEVEIRPGAKQNDKYSPLTTTIKSISAGGEQLKRARAGGSVGVGLGLDMYLTRADRLSGNVLGLKGQLPPVHDELRLKVKLLEEGEIKLNEAVMITAWTAKTVGVVVEKRKEFIRVRLKLPICIDYGERVALSQRKVHRWHLVGYGKIMK